jgi:hypothetical protein
MSISSPDTNVPQSAASRAVARVGRAPAPPVALLANEGWAHAGATPASCGVAVHKANAVDAIEVVPNSTAVGGRPLCLETALGERNRCSPCGGVWRDDEPGSVSVIERQEEACGPSTRNDQARLMF